MSTKQIRLDDLPIRRFHIKITALTFGAHLVDGYIIGLIGTAITQITPAMGLDAFWEGMVGASALLGLFMGSLFFGMVADKVGRQKIFNLSFVVIALGSISQFFVITPMQLVLCRIFIGIGMGGDYSVGHALLSEFIPRKHRGPILGSFSVIWTIGYASATFIGANLISFDFGPGSEAWRWLLASSFIPAVMVLIARLGAPESPRWLANQGRFEDAQAVLTKHFGPGVILGDEQERKIESGGYGTLFTPRYIKRTMFNCIFFVCLVIPYFAIYTFLPKILMSMQLSASVADDFMTGFILNCMLILGAFLGIWCTIKFSRRGFLIGSFAFLTVTLFLLSILPASQPLFLITVFAAFTLILSAVSNLVGVFPAESFPTEVRSSGIGLATAISRLGSAISTFLLPLSMLHFGVNITMMILAGVLMIGGFISWLWAPETKYLSLAEAAEVKE